MVSPIGFGAFKIGRNEKVKYAQAYELPSDGKVEHLLNGVLDLGINYIDTAPAYGLSEERIGRHIAHRKDEFILSTKVGETFENGQSRYDFSADAVRKCVARSRKRLGMDVLDIVFIHSDGNDLHILTQTDALQTLHSLKQAGDIRAIGFSGKTVDGARRAIADGVDAIMVDFHMNDQSHAAVIDEAASAGVGVVIKKGLASGALKPADGLPFLLRNRNIASVVIGGLNLDHFAENIKIAESVGGL